MNSNALFSLSTCHKSICLFGLTIKFFTFFISFICHCLCFLFLRCDVIRFWCFWIVLLFDALLYNICRYLVIWNLAVLQWNKQEKRTFTWKVPWPFCAIFFKSVRRRRQSPRLGPGNLCIDGLTKYPAKHNLCSFISKNFLELSLLVNSPYVHTIVTFSYSSSFVLFCFVVLFVFIFLW